MNNVDKFAGDYFGSVAPVENTPVPDNQEAQEMLVVGGIIIPKQAQEFIRMCAGKWTPVEFFCIIPVEMHRQRPEVDMTLRKMQVLRIIPEWDKVIMFMGYCIVECAVYDRQVQVRYEPSLRGGGTPEGARLQFTDALKVWARQNLGTQYGK